MNPERKWKTEILKRVVLNSFAGAFLATLVGALCGLATTQVIGWLDSGATAALKMSPDLNLGALIVNSMVAGYGWIGSLVGAIIFMVATVRAKPAQILAPFQSLIGRVMLGQIVGTIGFCSLFLSVEAARAFLSKQSFYTLAMDNLLWLMIGAPALMICGAIAGALSKRGT